MITIKNNRRNSKDKQKYNEGENILLDEGEKNANVL